MRRQQDTQGTKQCNSQEGYVINPCTERTDNLCSNDTFLDIGRNYGFLESDYNYIALQIVDLSVPRNKTDSKICNSNGCSRAKCRTDNTAVPLPVKMKIVSLVLFFSVLQDSGIL